MKTKTLILNQIFGEIWYAGHPVKYDYRSSLSQWYDHEKDRHQVVMTKDTLRKLDLFIVDPEENYFGCGFDLDEGEEN